MEVIETVAGWRGWRAGVRGRVCFVPTMGALHEGHLALMREAVGMGTGVASLFVNPTQFGPREDFGKYPRTREADLKGLEEAGCAAVFVPGVEEMYPRGETEVRSSKFEGVGGLNTETQEAGVTVDAGEMGRVLEGAVRPGHFRGVCTVVMKLLHVVGATHLLLGQKDYQQQAILRRMCEEMLMGVEVVTCATVREADGLAMSSRNRYLSAEERGRAVGLWEGLSAAKEAWGRGERGAGVLTGLMKGVMERRGIEVQYGVVADGRTLEVLEGEVRAGAGAVGLVAGRVGGTRLIDNVVLG